MCNLGKKQPSQGNEKIKLRTKCHTRKTSLRTYKWTSLYSLDNQMLARTAFTCPINKKNTK